MLFTTLVKSPFAAAAAIVGLPLLLLVTPAHSAPTLLSVVEVDASASRFADALSNKLYDRMMHADTVFHNGNNDVSDRLSTSSPLLLRSDKSEVSFGDSLTISWPREKVLLQTEELEGKDRDHGGRNGNGEGRGDGIVLALYCPADESNPRLFRDAATLDQVRATHRRGIIGAERDEEDASDVGGEEFWTIPSFPLVREESCQFRMFRADTDSDDDGDSWHFRVMGASPPISLGDSMRTPTGIHLSLTGNPSEMVVQFATGEAGKPVVKLCAKKERTGAAAAGVDAFPSPSFLRAEARGLESIQLQDAAEDEFVKFEGTSTTYHAGDMCQEPATVEEPGKFTSPGWLHTVTLVNLEPDREYTYKVGLAAGQGMTWASPSSFRAAPPTGADTFPFSFLALGDQGGPDRPGGSQVSELIVNLVDKGEDDDPSHLPVRAVHHHGDLSYAIGAGHIWDSFLSMIEPHASRVPMMVAVGNHEYDHTDGGGEDKDPSGVLAKFGFMPSWGNFNEDSGGECGVPFAKRFAAPPGGNGIFWYSYDHGPVHIAVLSSEHDLMAGSPQYEWLDADLAAVNRTTIPWIVVEVHRPLYNSDSAVGMGMRYEIEDLLRKQSVDLVLSGHYHAYLRTCDGLYHERCGAGGPMYITTGTGGAELDTHVLEENDWTEFYNASNFGVGRATFMNETALLWEFVPVNGNVTDQVWILRDRGV